MGKITRDELHQIREVTKVKMNNRDISEKEIQVIVSMGTCGIAKGAKDTLNAFLKELEAKNLNNAFVKQIGCVGACAEEPIVEIVVPGMPTTVYGNVSTDVVSKLVEEHIIGKKVVDSLKCKSATN